MLSARTPTALDAMSQRLAAWLRGHPAVPLADVALAFGARDTEGVLGTVEHLADCLGAEQASAVVAHQLPGLFAVGCDGGRIAVFGQQLKQAHAL